jgi:hypothetical protein
MRVDLNGLRASLTNDLDAFGEFLDSEILTRIGSLDLKVELAEKFNELASLVNVLNCVYSNKEELFDDISEKHRVSEIDVNYVEEAHEMAKC